MDVEGSYATLPGLDIDGSNNASNVEVRHEHQEASGPAAVRPSRSGDLLLTTAPPPPTTTPTTTTNITAAAGRRPRHPEHKAKARHHRKLRRTHK